MASRTDWGRVKRDKRLTYVPSQRSQPASQKQIDYIIGLAYRKGQPEPRLPKTKKGASDLIDRLIGLPDVNAPIPVRLVSAPLPAQPNTRQELVVELREHFPQLSPMSVNSMVQLFGQIDPLGMAFVFDRLMQDDAPEDADALILHILRKFLAEFGEVTDV